jgi:DNA-binding CsgD family transcriptional regulator
MTAADTHEATLAAFDLISLGVIITSADATVVRTNPCADRLMHDGRALTVQFGRLHAAYGEDTTALRRALSDVAGRKAYRAVSLRCPDGSTLPAMVHGLDSLAGVFVTDPADDAASPPSVLMELYGLTAAEARLASLLARGRSLEDAAAELRASRATLRTHLRRIFEKTDTCRQSALVRLLLRGPAQCRVV